MKRRINQSFVLAAYAQVTLRYLGELELHHRYVVPLGARPLWIQMNKSAITIFAIKNDPAVHTQNKLIMSETPPAELRKYSTRPHHSKTQATNNFTSTFSTLKTNSFSVTKVST